jgi:hypothetical protein
MGEMLMSEPTPMQTQDGRARKKGSAKANDEREGSNNLPPQKMEPFKFEIKGDFRWATMLWLGGFWKLHWAPIKKNLCMICLGDSIT